MPRHLISDAHEWINEILTVPIYYLRKYHNLHVVSDVNGGAVHVFGRARSRRLIVIWPVSIYLLASGDGKHRKPHAVSDFS
jgi:hypothetical protein